MSTLKQIRSLSVRLNDWYLVKRSVVDYPVQKISRKPGKSIPVITLQNYINSRLLDGYSKVDRESLKRRVTRESKNSISQL